MQSNLILFHQSGLTFLIFTSKAKESQSWSRNFVLVYKFSDILCKMGVYVVFVHFCSITLFIMRQIELILNKADNAMF